MSHFLRHTVYLALAWGLALQAGESSSVTILNRSGTDLRVRRPSGGAESPILVHAASDGSTTHHRLCAAFPHRSPEAECPLEYRIKEGDTVTFRFEEQDKDLQSELILWHTDPERGIVFKGTVIYTVTHQSPSGQEGPLEAVGRLSLPHGPTPMTRNIPINKDIRIISDSVMEIN